MKVLSIYSILFSNEGAYYLFNTETLLKAKISRTLYCNLTENRLYDIDASLQKVLEAKKVIVEKEHQYDFFDQMEIEANRINYDMTSMTLFLIPTMGCNFCCPYCFEGTKKGASMNQETIQNMLNFLNNSSAKNLSLHWYGGEPLLRLDLMKEIYKEIVEKTSLKIVNHSVITNGYLIDEEALDFFRSSKMKNIQITLDGKKETHDKKRYLKRSFAGTFDKIISSVKMLSRNLPESHISVRINIDKGNFKEFVDLYHYIHNECDFNNNIHVYPALIKIYDPLTQSLSSNCISNAELFSVYEFYKSHGCAVVFFPKAHKHTCSICNLNSYTIGPHGEIYKCPEDANKLEKTIGNINTGSSANEHLLMEYLTESSQFKREECKECACFPICYGGCGKEYLGSKHSQGKIDYCHPLKNLETLKKAFLEDVKDNHKEVSQNLQFTIY